MPGRGQGRAEDRHQRHQHDHVEGQRNGGDHAEETVDDDDEQRYEEHAPERRIDTLGDVVRPQARADGAFFGEVHRRSQAAGTQQQGQLGGLARAIEAGDTELVAQRRLDGRQADDLLLFLERRNRDLLLDAIDHLLGVAGHRLLLDEHHRHAAADVVAGGAVHQLAAMAIQADVHLRAAVLVETGAGVGDLVAGDDHPALQRHRRPARLAGTRRSRWRTSGRPARRPGGILGWRSCRGSAWLPRCPARPAARPRCDWRPGAEPAARIRPAR